MIQQEQDSVTTDKGCRVIDRGRTKAKPSQPLCFSSQGMLPGGLDGDQRYFVTWHIKNEGIPVPKPLDHGRSLIVIHKVKYSKANQAQIRSSANTSDLTQCIHTHTRVKLHRASEMPHKGRDKSTSFQHFPTGHLLLRISSVSWVLEYVEWTHYSVQPLEQKFPPPSKLHYCMRFCSSGEKKRQTFKYFMFSDGTFHLPRGAFHTCWCCFWGVVQWDSFARAGKCPKCPRVAQIWLLLTWAAQWPRAVTSAGISPAATWRLLELCVDLRCCCSTPDTWEVQNKK